MQVQTACQSAQADRNAHGLKLQIPESPSLRRWFSDHYITYPWGSCIVVLGTTGDYLWCKRRASQLRHTWPGQYLPDPHSSRSTWCVSVIRHTCPVHNLLAHCLTIHTYA